MKNRSKSKKVTFYHNLIVGSSNRFRVMSGFRNRNSNPHKYSKSIDFKGGMRFLHNLIEGRNLDESSHYLDNDHTKSTANTGSKNRYFYYF